MCPDTRVSAYVSVYDLVCSVCATLYTVYFRAVSFTLHGGCKMVSAPNFYYKQNTFFDYFNSETHFLNSCCSRFSSIWPSLACWLEQPFPGVRPLLTSILKHTFSTSSSKHFVTSNCTPCLLASGSSRGSEATFPNNRQRLKILEVSPLEAH